MEKHWRRVLIATIAVLILMWLCLAMLATAAISGLASYGVGFYSLTQYTKGNNEWIVYFNETCEKKRPARRGRSHNKPEWTGYWPLDNAPDVY